MHSFSNPGLANPRTPSGLASAVTTAAAAGAAACTLCVSPRHSARHMLGVVRAMRASRVSARRVCEKHLNECELGPQDTNERERWRKCRGRRVTHTHRHTHTLSQQKSVPVCVSRSRVRESAEPRVSARRVRVRSLRVRLSKENLTSELFLKETQSVRGVVPCGMCDVLRAARDVSARRVRGEAFNIRGRRGRGGRRRPGGGSLRSTLVKKPSPV